MPLRRPLHRPLRRPLAPALVLLAAACADGAPTSSVSLRDGAGERVPMTRLRADPHPLTFSSGIGEPARAVVRDDALWAATWTAVWAQHAPTPPLPAVDFSREMVVVAALGARSGGGHAILLDSATVRGGTLVVHVRATAPGPRCAVTGALTAPVDAARLARHDGPIEFEERQDVARCD